MADEGRPPLSKHAMVRGVLVGVASIYNRDTSSTTESDGALQGREDRRGYVPEVLLHIDHQQHRSGGVGATTPYLVFVFVFLFVFPARHICIRIRIRISPNKSIRIFLYIPNYPK